MDDLLYAIAVFILHYTCRGACMYDVSYPAKGSLDSVVRYCPLMSLWNWLRFTNLQTE